MSDEICIADKVEKAIERNVTTENPEQVDGVFWLKPESIPINTANSPHSRWDKSFPIWSEEREWGEESVIAGQYQIPSMMVGAILHPTTEETFEEEQGIIYPYISGFTVGMPTVRIGNNVLVDYSLPFLNLSFGEPSLPSALEQRLEQFRQLSEDELLDYWDRYLEEHWDDLVVQYKGKYVAIWNNDVYDSDEDLAALAERVYAALGYRPIFMPYIGKQRRVAEFFSPV